MFVTSPTTQPGQHLMGGAFRFSQAIHLVVVGFLGADELVAVTEDHGPMGDGRRGTMAAWRLLQMERVA